MMVESAQTVQPTRTRERRKRTKKVRPPPEQPIQTSRHPEGEQDGRQKPRKPLQNGEKYDNRNVIAHRQARSRPTNTCDSLIVNNQTIEFKLRWVERCLTQLVIEESLQDDGEHDEESEEEEGRQQFYGLVRASAPPSSSSDKPTAATMTTTWSARFDEDRSRIKTMLQIYEKLLRCPPPPFDLLATVGQRQMASNRQVASIVQDARQRVLIMIEHLEGYCDSINLLRCILRSSQFAAVISAFDIILEKIHYINSTQRCDFVPQVEDSHEFRIVQEWRF